MEYIVRIYRYSEQYNDHAYPIADIVMTGPIFGSETKFAQEHGGDFIEILDLEEAEIQQFSSLY